MTYENETALKVGPLSLTLTEANFKSAIAVATDSVAGHEGSHIKSEAIKRGGIQGVNAHGILTNKRFIFGEGKPFKKQTVGAPLSISEKGKVVLDIPLEDILKISEGKQGFSPLMIIETNAGDYRFAFMRKSACEEWEKALNDIIKK